MRFKTDENLHPDAAQILRLMGHDVQTAHEEGLNGAPDEELSDACRREGRALVTWDMGFADITAYPPCEHPGIIVLRLAIQNRRNLVAVLARAVPEIIANGLDRKLWIASERGLRVRS